MFQFMKEPVETLEAMVKNLSTVNAATPDESLLRNRPYHLIFDYGPRLRYPRVSTAFTVERLTLFNKSYDNDGVTALAFRTRGLPRARVLGQVYCVTTDQVMELDNHKRNGYAFYRKRAPLYFPFLDENRDLVKHPAWMYLARPEAWKEQMDWDKSFYRNHGEFQIPKVNHAPDNFREFEKLRYFKYSPVISKRTGPHLRDAATHEMVKDRDKSIQESADRDLRMNKVIGQSIQEAVEHEFRMRDR